MKDDDVSKMNLMQLMSQRLWRTELLTLLASLIITTLIFLTVYWFLQASSEALLQAYTLEFLLSAMMTFSLIYGVLFAILIRLNAGDILTSKVIEPLEELANDVSGAHWISGEAIETKEYELAEVQHLHNLLSAHIKNFHMVYEHLDVLKITDPITGLFNRQYFYEIAKQEGYIFERYGRIFSLVVIQVTYLKHPTLTENEMLLRFSQLLQNSIRHADMLFHITDRVFIVLAPETDSEKVYSFVKDFGQRVFKQNDALPEFKCEFKLGYATYGSDGKQVDELIRASMKNLMRVEPE